MIDYDDYSNDYLDYHWEYFENYGLIKNDGELISIEKFSMGSLDFSGKFI